MILTDITWMPPEAQKAFCRGVEAFAQGVRCGHISEYQTGEQLMREAGQIVIQSDAAADYKLGV